MGTWRLRHTLIVLFSFGFLPSHIHLNTAVTDLICIANIVMKTDLNSLNSFKNEFVLLILVDATWTKGGGGVVVTVKCVTKGLFYFFCISCKCFDNTLMPLSCVCWIKRSEVFKIKHVQLSQSGDGRFLSLGCGWEQIKEMRDGETLSGGNLFN